MIHKFAFLVSIVAALSACSSSSSSLPEIVDPDAEVMISEKESESLIGSYVGPDAEFTIETKQSFRSISRTEIGLHAGRPNTKHQLYAYCTISEEGTFELFMQRGYKHLRTKASKVKLVKAEKANRGTKIEPLTVCNLYVEARLASAVVRQYEAPVDGVLMLKDWRPIEFGTYNGESTSFNALYPTPTAVGLLMSKVASPAPPVTEVVGRFLAAGASAWGNSTTLAFDLKSRQVRFQYSACSFALDFPAEIALVEGKMALRPTSPVVISDTEGSPINPAGCQDQRNKFLGAKFATEGLSLKFVNWNAMELRFDFHLLWKEIPEDVASEGLDTVMK